MEIFHTSKINILTKQLFRDINLLNTSLPFPQYPSISKTSWTTCFAILFRIFSPHPRLIKLQLPYKGHGPMLPYDRLTSDCFLRFIPKLGVTQLRGKIRHEFLKNRQWPKQKKTQKMYWEKNNFTYNSPVYFSCNGIIFTDFPKLSPSGGPVCPFIFLFCTYFVCQSVYCP